ncbi:MAG: hypothetical protein HYV28_10050 [Ignavibacteriales bacterium]|nr:hypothetical protein [Ignavibacteriales bacterium]
MSLIRIMIASPSDIESERVIAKSVIKEYDENFARIYGFAIDVFMWEVDVYPSFHEQGVQGNIDNRARFEELDIFIGIFKSKLGTLLPDSNETGTEHEVNKAFKAWKVNNKPEIMLYFNTEPIAPSLNNLKDLEKLLTFKKDLPKECFYKNYVGEQFEAIFKKNLLHVLISVVNKKNLINSTIPIQKKSVNEIVSDKIDQFDIDEVEMDKILITKNLYSSFHPSFESNIPCFYRLKLETTSGFVEIAKQKNIALENTESEEVANIIYLIRDPIRPFEIQIGETRAMRPGASPGFLVLEYGLSLRNIKRIYPFILGENDKWLRIVFAELSVNPEVLRFIYKKDPDKFVRGVAAKNPRASTELQEKECLFCNPKFHEKRTVSKSDETRIIRNDYPYGPYFHYIAMPISPLHSWADAEEKHFFDMNMTIVQFLNYKENGLRKNLNNSSGIRMGLNSSIRHLVLGKSTQSSAGASIPHVHKQIWGMSPHAVNLGDHLAKICHHYSEKGIDYLGAYIDALRLINYIIWEDDNCALYVPFGQISIHELQVIIKRRNTSNFLHLTDKEIYSLSKCEYIVTKIFERLGINSFNELLISMPFDYEKKDYGFRLILTFITREVDIAVSELSLLYVVDKFPHHSRDEIRRIWGELKNRYNF